MHRVRVCERSEGVGDEWLRSRRTSNAEIRSEGEKGVEGERMEGLGCAEDTYLYTQLLIGLEVLNGPIIPKNACPGSSENVPSVR